MHTRWYLDPGRPRGGVSYSLAAQVRSSRRTKLFYVIFAGLLLVSVVGSPSFSQSSGMPERVTVYGDFLAGMQARRVGDRASAAKYFNRAHTADPGDPLLLEQAFVYSVAIGDFENGVRLAQEIVADQPSHRLARYVLGADVARQGRFKRARFEFLNSRQEGEPDPLSEVMRSWSFFATGQIRHAREVLENITGDRELALLQIFHLVLQAELSGENDRVEALFERAFQIGEASIRLIEARARFLTRTASPGQALVFLREQEPDTFERATLLHLEREIVSSPNATPLVPSSLAGLAEVFFNIGSSLDSRGDEDFAVAYLQIALALAPEHDGALFTLGEINFNAGSRVGDIKKLERASDFFSKILPTQALYRHAQLNRARVLILTDETDEAYAIFTELVKTDPLDLRVIINYETILRQKEEYSRAVDVLDATISRLKEAEDLEHWLLYYHRGICFERLKLWPKAEVDFKSALKLSPGNADVLNYLGYSWVDQDLNIDEGLELIQEAVTQRPDDGFIVDSLGWAFYKLGRFDESVEQLELAVSLQAGDPVINDHLGDALWKVGRRLEAQYQWRHVLGLQDIDGELREAVEKKIRLGLEPADNPVDREAFRAS